MMKAQKLIRWLCLTGILGLLFYLLHDWLGGMAYPGYNRMAQAVSDLTAADAPSRGVAGGLSTVYGLLSCLSGVMVCLVVDDLNVGNRAFRLGTYLFAVMNWVSAVGYALFPLSGSGYAGTFQDVMHMYVVTAAVVLLSIAALLLIAIGGFKARTLPRTLPVFALAALICMFAGAMSVNLVPAGYFGVAERLSTYSAVVFTAVLGWYGFRLFGTNRSMS
ncbi:MAG: DUF998 domain-containing protein [Eubacteriales bacterium]|nr:DUF998 domain-containing protein [Eubacteriales bacterium]